MIHAISKYMSYHNVIYRTFTCYVFLLSPVISSLVLVLTLTPIYDVNTNAMFWITFAFYVYLYVYMMFYGFLALFNSKYHLIYFHPFTYIGFVLLLPALPWLSIGEKMENGENMNESVSTNSSIENYDIEGFAEVKPKMDENIFEIYDRLTLHDQMFRTKSFRKTVVMKPIQSKTKILIDNDVPSVEDDISRLSEESKLELCPVCQESLDKSQHQVNSTCGHEFHFKCLIKAMKDTKICPVCNEKLRPK